MFYYNMFKKVPFFNIILLLIFLPLLSTCDELPDAVDISDIPNYYFENNYLEERVKEINHAIEECSDNCESFFWITDMHWEPDLNTRKSPLLIKYIASKTGISKILNGGDTGNSQVICKNAIDQLREAIGSNSVYTVTGNHEINDASRYENPFGRVADELRGHNSDIVYGDKNKSYFYVDIVDSKTRIIGLSSYGLFLNGSYESCYSDDQFSWFKKTALDVKEGWIAIIFTHNLFNIGPSDVFLKATLTGASRFIEGIDNYKGNGSIACVLMGHTHRDRLHYGSSGIPYIISACDRHKTYYGDINVERIPGTVSEHHFEVVVIDKGRRIIKLFSIGANAKDGYDDDPGKEVNVRVVNY